MYVLVPKNTKTIEKAVEKLLKQYDEELQVKEYKSVCGCVHSQARKEAGIPELNIFPAMQDHDRVHHMIVLPDNLDAYIKVWQQFIDRYGSSWPNNTSLLRLYKPNPDCMLCRGAGLISNKTNPQGKWDWWVIGADSRFHGVLQSKQNSDKAKLSDAVPVRDLDPQNLQIPDAIVTPDGKWHEQVYVPFVGCVVINEIEWKQTFEIILKEHSDAIIVAVDCHT